MAKPDFTPKHEPEVLRAMARQKQGAGAPARLALPAPDKKPPPSGALDLQRYALTPVGPAPEEPRRPQARGFSKKAMMLAFGIAAGCGLAIFGASRFYSEAAPKARDVSDRLVVKLPRAPSP